MNDPLAKEKSDYKDIIEKIGADTNVGIDTQLTHAIIIDYLKQISAKVDKLEDYIKAKIDN